MKGKHSRRKIGIALILEFISVTTAVLALLQSILDLSITLPEQYKWPIFIGAIIISVAIPAWWVFWPRLDPGTQPAQSMPGRLPLDGNIKRYIERYKLDKSRNHIYIQAARFTLTLNRSKDISILGEHLVDQTVRWTLEGNYTGSAPMTSFSLMVTLSMFTSWNDGSIQISAQLKKRLSNGTFQTYRIDEQNIQAAEQQENEDTRCVIFAFPAGVQCERAEHFIFEIVLDWKRGAHFYDTVRYFSDPRNYGEAVERLVIDVDTDMEELMRRDFKLYSVKKGDNCLAPSVREAKILTEKRVQWMLGNPDMDAVYVIEILRQQETAV